MTTLTSTNVYQLIWDADQAGNGVRPILSTDTTTPRDPEKGYVIVDWPTKQNDPDHKVLKDAVIPDKDQTYEKCKALYDNYALSSSDPEVETEQDKVEIEEFINAIKDTPPMKIAREYLDVNQTDDEWKDFIKEKWFTIFGGNYRSGFEHVFVGENSGQSPTNIGGYHFWHKYYIDDGNDEVSGKDTIDFVKSKDTEGQEVPEVVTLQFKWDPEDDDINVLQKPKGGFWVGCSPEGLIALGMARWKQKTIGKTKAVINGALYELTLYTEIDRRIRGNELRTDDMYINTFWPKFLKVVATGPPIPPPPPEKEGVRIIAALVNPFGNDVGFENVTLINTSNADTSLNGWSIVDKNNNVSGLMMQLGAGEAKTVTLSGAPGTAQLGNNGGSITLLNRDGISVDSVSYSRSQAKKDEGTPILFF